MEGLEHYRGRIDPMADTEVEKTKIIRESVDPKAETVLVDLGQEREAESNPDLASEAGLDRQKDAILETTRDPEKFLEQLSSFLSIISGKRKEGSGGISLEAGSSFPQKILELLRFFNANETSPKHKEFIRKEVWNFLNRKQGEEILASFSNKNLIGDEGDMEKGKLSAEIEKISRRYNEAIDEMNRYLDEGQESRFVRRE